MGKSTDRDRLDEQSRDARIQHLEGLVDAAADRILALGLHSPSLLALVDDMVKRRRLARLREQREERSAGGKRAKDA